MRTALALLLLSTPALAQSETRTLSGRDVSVYNLVGTVRAVAGTGREVSVQVTRRGADAGRVRIESGTVRGRESLRIFVPSDRIVYPDMRRSRTEIRLHEDGTFNEGDWDDWRSRDRVRISGSGDGLEAYAEVVVSVPRGQRISLYLGVGRMDVSNVEGDVLVDVAAAEVEVVGVKGPLSLDTGSGRVSVRDVTGDLTVDAGSGTVNVAGVKGTVVNLDTGSGTVDARDIEARDFTAETGSGGVRVTGLKAPNVRVETGSGSATIEMLSDVEDMNVESGSGGVTLRVPATLNAEIEAESGSGGFHTDFEIVTWQIGRNHVRGRIGAGKGRIRLESGSGSIRLLKI